MSRIGNKPIELPEKVEVVIDKSNVVTVKGPKGQLIQKVDADITVNVQDKSIVLQRATEQKRHKAMHGLYRSLINNMVNGVSGGYKKELELVGVGYKASNQGNILELSLGYSHSIFFVVPSEIKVATVTEKGKNPTIILEGYDKQLMGQICAKLKSFRKSEPYKGKGIRFANEVIRRKAGKTSAKK
ncbi:MAG: 50S ribosomal protein L6 [Bacteroidota bacterium]|nr:50S ribosomal protein L6 [Bacteroidota bacterium]